MADSTNYKSILNNFIFHIYSSYYLYYKLKGNMVFETKLKPLYEVFTLLHKKRVFSTKPFQ